MLYIMHAEINGENFGISILSYLMQKLFKRIKMVCICQRIYPNHTHEQNWKVPVMSFAHQKPDAALNFFYASCREKLFFRIENVHICISDWNSISHFQNMGWNLNQINEFCILCDCFQYYESKVLIRSGFYAHTSPQDFSFPSPWTYHKIHDLWCQFWWRTSLISNINCLGY